MGSQLNELLVDQLASRSKGPSSVVIEAMRWAVFIVEIEAAATGPVKAESFAEPKKCLLDSAAPASYPLASASSLASQSCGPAIRLFKPSAPRRVNLIGSQGPIPTTGFLSATRERNGKEACWRGVSAGFGRPHDDNSSERNP